MPVEPEVGCVVIGRNEGRRLRGCLESVLAQCKNTVYVDSGSVDGSADLARGMDVVVVELDSGRPFNAARARNEGYQSLSNRWPTLQFVQFVDADCELDANWFRNAAASLRKDDKLAVVVGRTRERHPEQSVFNRLADIEWHRVVGPIDASGGVAMMRAAAFASVSGFDERLIALEEPELCLRLRRHQWRLACIDAEMMTHDLAMHRMGQWWRRSRRLGYCTGQAVQLHGSAPERFYVRPARRSIFWGGLVPFSAIGIATITNGWGLLLLLSLLWPTRGAYRHARRQGSTLRNAQLYGLQCTAAKLPEFIGLVQYQLDRLLRRPALIIEHK